MTLKINTGFRRNAFVEKKNRAKSKGRSVADQAVARSIMFIDGRITVWMKSASDVEGELEYVIEVFIEQINRRAACGPLREHQMLFELRRCFIIHAGNSATSRAIKPSKRSTMG